MAGESLIGNLAVLLTMETAAFEKGSSHASKLLRKTQREFEATAQKMVGIGRNLSIGITAPLVGFGAVAIREANEANAAMAQVNAALKSMGPVAGKTAEQLKAASNALELSSMFEGDEILRKVTANLLTFGNISGKAFDQAQQAAVNLSARLGTDLQSSALLVGKALNDPIKGLAAMGRVGIQFTASQKEAIKSMVEMGNTAGAQAIILKELERQFGGAAMAAQNADPYNKATDAFKQMAETVGTSLLPIIPVFTNAIVSITTAFSGLSPGMQKFLIIAGGISAAVGPILIAFGALVSVTGTMLPLILKLGPAFMALKAGVAAVSLASGPLLASLLPIAAPLLAIAAAAGVGYLAWKNWDKIVAIAQRVYTGVKTWLVDKFGAIVESIRGKIDAVTGFFRGMWDKVVGNSYVPDMVAQIGVEIAKLDALMVQPTERMTEKAAAAFQKLQESAGQLKGLLERLFPESVKENALIADLATLDKALAEGKIKAEQYGEALARLITSQNPEAVQNAALAATGMASPGSGGTGGGGDTGQLPPELSPFQRWAESVPQTAKQINEALQGIAAQGLDNIANALTGVIMGTESLGKAFGNIAKQIIADLIQMTIKMLIFKALAAAFPGVFGAPGSIPESGGARARGGPVIRNRAYLVGERGPELFMPGSSGNIISNDNLRQAQNVNVTQTFQFEGVAVTKQEFMQGMMLTKTATVAAIRDMNRRR